MTTAAPVRYFAAVEDIQSDESETIAQLNETFDTILETTAKDYAHAVRSVHAKAHGILEGTLLVEDGLSAELAQGLFATVQKHKVYIRISTNAGDILSDAVSLPRGLAIKVLDVEGERLPGADGKTQDFVMVNGPVFQTKTSAEFLGNLKMLAKTTDKLEETKKVVSSILQEVNAALGAVGVESPKIQSLGGAPNVEPLGETYYSVTPFRYGDYIAKFSIAPSSPELRQLTGKVIETSGRPDALRETIRQEMGRVSAVWALRVQLCRDLSRQPIEDPTVKWSEEESPYTKVATITVAAQDSWEEARVYAVDEQMRFSIWTGLAAHQPLGNINRARKETYRHSADFRERFNRCPIHEPSGSRS